MSFARSGITVLLVMISVVTLADDYLPPVGCGSAFGRPGQYGPFDYTNPEHFKEKLPIVERYHFNLDVEDLKKGLRGTVPGDLDYTLRAFPNHHRALKAMTEYQRRHGLPPANANYVSAECYFVRAIEFKPDDAKVYMIYGDFLHKSGYLSQALKNYEAAKRLQPSSPDPDYHIALMYIDAKDFKRARSSAEIYYRRGGTKPELRNKLESAGEWKNPK